jgi:four helix bundle protein
VENKGAKMGSIRRFEDLDVWRKSRELVRAVYGLSAQGKFSRDFGLQGQLRRAAVSVMSNIAEGFERGGNKEFLRFLAIAKGSCGEIRSQLYVACDQGYLTQPQFTAVCEGAMEVSRMLAGMMRHLRQAALPGEKQKDS